jgi:hypothetical protein
MYDWMDSDRPQMVNRCIRLQLTAFFDVKGTDCSMDPLNEQCSVCSRGRFNRTANETLYRPKRSPPRDLKLVDQANSALNVFALQWQEAKQRTVHRQKLVSADIDHIRKTLDRFLKICVRSSMAPKSSDTATPSTVPATQRTSTLPLRGRYVIASAVYVSSSK